MKKILMATAFFVISFALIVPAQGACPGNLIVNGDFEAGNTGFSTDYTYILPSNTGTWTLGPEETYTVSTDPNDYHSAWKSFGDHTTGAGNMMILNAACVSGSSYCTGESALTAKIWSQTVNVQKNTLYTFSYWIALSYSATGTYPTQPPQIQVTISGEELGIFDAQTIVNEVIGGGGSEAGNGAAGIWMQVKYDWFSGNATSAEIVLIDKHAWQYGDDFVLDDIELCATYCAETNLIAGGGNPASAMDVGGVSIQQYEDNLYITYTVEAPWCFTELHLAVATDLSLIPQKNGNPIPGKFPYYYYPEGGACENTYTFPLIPECDGPYIAAHAAVQRPAGCLTSSECVTAGAISDPETGVCSVPACQITRFETAWGEGQDFPGKNWAMYFEAMECILGGCSSP